MLKNILQSTTKLVLLIVAFVLLVIFNWNTWKKNQENKQAIKKLQKQLILQQQENGKMQASNDELRRHIDSLKRGSVEMIEEEARDNFGMVGEGETFFDFKSQADQDK